MATNSSKNVPQSFKNKVVGDFKEVVMELGNYWVFVTYW
jgi:hypothetical protein